MIFFKYFLVIYLTLFINSFINATVPGKYRQKLDQLNLELIKNNVPDNWLMEKMEPENFVIYYQVEDLFYNMAENVVKREERDFEWYKKYFGLDIKANRGFRFIGDHLELLKNIEKITGIHFEFAVAVLAMESNYADPRYRGTYLIFNTLISQYLLVPERENYAIKQLIALYFFSKRIDKDMNYFIGSFAGACGWAQFIPTSLLSYFQDMDGIDDHIDIYAIDDSLISIINYLQKHGLNPENLEVEESRYHAVYSYNHSDAYVKAVLYLYDQFRNFRLQNGG